MKIKIQTKDVYGRPLRFPVCEKAKLLSHLGRRRMGKHSFNLNDLAILEKLGYEIEEVPRYRVLDGK